MRQADLGLRPVAKKDGELLACSGFVQWSMRRLCGLRVCGGMGVGDVELCCPSSPAVPNAGNNGKAAEEGMGGGRASGFREKEELKSPPQSVICV